MGERIAQVPELGEHRDQALVSGDIVGGRMILVHQTVFAGELAPLLDAQLSKIAGVRMSPLLPPYSSEATMSTAISTSVE